MAAYTLYTIGHSTHPIDTFLALLDQHRLRVLVDVRSTPYSQFNPQFNQHTLQASVEAHGLEYRYAGEFLGGRPKDPTLYKTAEQAPNTEAWAYPDVRYDALMRSDVYMRGIRRLLDLAAAAPTVIMCSEANPHDCHRHHLIARSLVDPLVRVVPENVRVIHINRDGSLTETQADDFNAQLPLF